MIVHYKRAGGSGAFWQSELPDKTLGAAHGVRGEREFYAALAEGAAIGEAVLRARQRVRQEYPADPTWLAYRCFADPLARVGGFPFRARANPCESSTTTPGGADAKQ